MKQKTPVYRNLRSIPVYFEDTSLNSDELFRITEFPLRLTAGKNIFKLQGNPNNLNNGSYLNIEILDYNGDPIYNEVTSVITEDDSRIVSVYIYSDTPPGDADVTLVTVANSLFGQTIPTEWKDKPNVRWSRRVPVNPTQENISEIIFSELPTVTLKEQVGVQLNRTYVTTQYPTYSTGKVQYISKNSQPALIISGGSFNNEMVGGTVTVTSPANPFPTPYYSVSTIPYSSTIKKVLSTSSILLDTEYKIASSESIIPHTYNMFGLSTYSISYEATPTYVPTQNSESYALIEIDNLEPVSGDVSRIKVYMNNMGTVGTWELINDIELEETNIFVTNTASVEPYKSIGDITSQSVINTYYKATSYLGKSTQTAPTLVYDNTDLSNAIKISSNADLSGRNRVHVLQTTASVAGKFVKGASYKITFDAVGTKTLTTGDTAPNILVYVSGSAFKYDYGDYYNQELPIRLGKKVGDLYTYNDSQRFDDQTFYFDADATGDGVLIFVIKGGEWKLSDIQTTTDNDKGFTPAYTRLRSLVPTPHKSNVQFSFKVEYYNSDGAKSKQISYLDNISWQGGNRYVDGEYSMITGSLYVADSLENGIAISGYKDTGYIRSLGYDGFNAGFPGFLLWSGSAMKATDNNYNGVGLELYADRDNYFRYRTNPSELVVKTKSFYFGSSSQYISGSNGSIAISSSNFYLDPSGNVTLSGVVNITGGSGFATPTSVSASINTATGSLSASLNTTITSNSASSAGALGSVSSSLNTTINANSASAASALGSVSASFNTSLSNATDRIVTDAANKIVKPNDTPGGGAGLYLSQKYLGYYNASAWNAYISSSGEFLFKKDDNNQISFGAGSLILKVSDTVFMSGSNISLITPNFFFGNGTQFISGSNGNLVIKSPNFVLGDSTQFISGSNGNLVIKSNNFNVSANGSVTASNALFSGVNTSNVIRRKSVTITTANSSSYLNVVGSSPPYYALYLDGTLGGEKVQHAIIGCSLKTQAWSYEVFPGAGFYLSLTGSLPIGSIVFPNIVAGESAECFIEIASGVTAYMTNNVGAMQAYQLQQGYPTELPPSTPPGGYL